MKSKTARSSTPPPLLAALWRALEDKKAGDLRVLRVDEQSSITDYLVLATGTSEPHLRALRVELEKVIDASKTPILGMDNVYGSGWLVIDAFDVMIHIFTPENREKYALENLWKDAVELTPAELLNEPAVPKEKKAPKAPAKPRVVATKAPARAKTTTGKPAAAKAKPVAKKAAAKKPAAKSAKKK